jgi:hypothetical protein
VSLVVGIIGVSQEYNLHKTIIARVYMMSLRVVFFFKMESHFVAQAGLILLGSSNPPASAS